MKITELRCPACGGTMKISEEDPGIAVCEYCQSRYVLEREGDDARLGGAVSAQRRQMGTPAPKPAKKLVLWPAVMMSSFIAVLMLAFVFVPLMQEPGAGGDGQEGAVPAGNEMAGFPEQEMPQGLFMEAAEQIFDKSAQEITKEELGSIQWLQVGYANSGADICISYSMENPLAEEDADIQSLYFDRSSAELDYGTLSQFTGLKGLAVGGYLPEGCLKGLELEYLSCYAHSPKEAAQTFDSAESLKELYLSSGLDSLEGLELFPSVERLGFDGYELTDLTELAAARQVKELNLENCDEVTDFSVLSVMNWLEHLSVESEGLKAISFISNMNNLESLKLYGGSMVTLAGLEEKAETLKELVIESCDNLRDCSQVSALTGLTNLEIEVPYDCEAPDLSGLTVMEELTLSGFDSTAFLFSMPALKKLSLSSMAVDNPSVFQGLGMLEELRCTSFSGNMDDLSFIAGLPALKRLDLTGASTYYDISALFNIPALESFCLDGMECEINFDKLQDNPSLKVLSMDGIKLYKNVQVDGGGGILYVDWDDVILDEHTGFLAHYPNLESLSLADNELTQVEFGSSLGNMKTLDISENYVTDVRPLAGAPSLRTLILTGNPVDNLRMLDERVQVVN